jgi:hypothetical protein
MRDIRAATISKLSGTAKIQNILRLKNIHSTGYGGKVIIATEMAGTDEKVISVGGN